VSGRESLDLPDDEPCGRLTDDVDPAVAAGRSGLTGIGVSLPEAGGDDVFNTFAADAAKVRPVDASGPTYIATIQHHVTRALGVHLMEDR
jgi:hypothetical protein